MRLAVAAVCSSALLGSTAPQRAQHVSAALPPRQSALISGCAVFYDTANRTLNVFRTVQDCSQRADAAVWRQTLPVMEPHCYFPTNATVPRSEPPTCSANGEDSSYLPPCVTTLDGLPADPQHLPSQEAGSTKGLTWHMSFFSGGECDLDAPSLVLRGRSNECDQCEVDARGAGGSHRYAHAFHSLIADGIAGTDESTVVQAGSPVFAAARRDADLGDGLTPGQWPALLESTPMPGLLLLLLLSALLILLAAAAVVKIVLRQLEETSCCVFRCCLCCCPGGWRRILAPPGDPGEDTSGHRKSWLGVAQEDSLGSVDSSTAGLVSAEKLELDDIM